ncbi:MAG: hypothetical protein H6Q10_1173 [Acidobacteria bacterium]|nr:hypothetical protein [Acidobacteriota bacterium]
MAHRHTHAEYIPPPDMKHETRDLSTRVVVIFGASLVAGAVIVLVAVWWLFVAMGRANQHAYAREYPLARVGAPQPPPSPRLQTQPREELKRMRQEEDAVLSGYGWADPNAGRVRIPIDRAMQLLVEQGLPSRPGGSPGPGGLPEDSSSGRTLAPAGK